MQGSFSILSMLYRSCSIKTDFPVPRSPARIVRLFRGIPFGRTLSTASIPVSNDFGSKSTPSESQADVVEIKDIVTVLTAILHARFLRSPPYAVETCCFEDSDLESIGERTH